MKFGILPTSLNRWSVIHASIRSRSFNCSSGMERNDGTKARRRSQGELVGLLMKSPSFPLTSGLIDIAVNLADASFNKDREKVIERSRQAGVQALISTGVSLDSTKRTMEICETYQSILPLYFTAGIHPHYASTMKDEKETMERLRQLASHQQCVAVGETGLDFYRNLSTKEEQIKSFRAHIHLASEMDLPLLLHCRGAASSFFEILQEYRPPNSAKPMKGVLHCFTGTKDELLKALDLGLHIGITGWISDERPDRGGKELASLLPLIPYDRIMIETDAPYIAPRNLPCSQSERPRRNEPAMLPWVAASVAEARGEKLTSLTCTTTKNAIEFFKI